MAILIYVQNRDVSSWTDALLQEDPSLDIRVYPNIGNKKDITFALTWPFPFGFWNQFPNLQTICSIGAGVNHILSDSSIDQHIHIVKLVDKNLSQNMWEYCLAAVSFYTMKINLYQNQQKKSIWKELEPPCFNTTTVGIMGLGSIGLSIAKNFAQLGFKVKGYSNTAKDISKVETFCAKDSIEDFLHNVDIVISLLPLTTQTKGIFNQTFFSKMKKGAYFINAGRADQVIEKDLIEALNTQQLNGAFLDVFKTEPLESSHPFWKHPKITITPHVASITNPISVAPQIVNNYRNTQKGYPLKNLVNIQSGY
ncbi:MAG: glyoxylate/hydroxypyruvate reductase A [Campylobacterota bacterium]|nr:glyoxylate/hydroxypyruvate reductase A [Campylobacterota bacterium]